MNNFFKIAFDKLKEQTLIVLILLAGIYMTRSDSAAQIKEHTNRIGNLEVEIKDCHKATEYLHNRYDGLLERILDSKTTRFSHLTDSL